ncbi:MAG: hypothetical protein ABFS19_10960 [Thermodesulfobacteriota bacterium]
MDLVALSFKSLTFSLILIILPVTLQAEEWYMASRHGECVSLKEINSTMQVVRGAETPKQMAAKLKEAGVKYTLKPLRSAEEGLYRLDVPSTEWAMLLVKKKFCKEVLKQAASEQ